LFATSSVIRSAQRALVVSARACGACIAFSACIAFAACADRSAPKHGAETQSVAQHAISVVDDAGRTITLDAPAHRVISMIPAQTEIVKILGGVDRLVARTQWDKDTALSRLPSTGNALTPSVEWLTAQHPDLVIAWPDNDSRNVIEQLRPLGIPVYSSRVESLTEITSMIRRIGTLLGTDARADSLVRSIDAQLDSVRASVAGLPRPLVLYALSTDPPMAAGGSTFVGQVIEAAGGTNLFADVKQLWPQVSLEEIVRRQPDVILLPIGETGSGSARNLQRAAGWRDLRAVKEGRVYEVDADLFHRPGASVGIAARTAAALLHPELSDGRTR
jgi:iron complex transport system substrate-binding protein